MSDTATADDTTTEAEKTAAETGKEQDDKSVLAGNDKPAGGQPKVEGGDKPVSADWREGLEGELRDFAGRFTTAKDLAQAALDLRKANSGMIRLPGKDAKPEEVAKFRKAIGAGEKVEEYAFEMPKGIEANEGDKAFQAKVAEIMHTTGVPLATAKALNSAWNEMTTAMQAEAERVAVAKREAAVAELRKDLGADYDSHLALATRAARTFGGDDFINFVNTTMVDGAKLGDHPAFIKAFGTIGRRMGEGDFIGVVNDAEKGTLEGELEKLMRDNPPGTAKYNDPAVQKRVREINEKLYGTAPLVGQGGRGL